MLHLNCQDMLSTRILQKYIQALSNAIFLNQSLIVIEQDLRNKFYLKLSCSIYEILIIIVIMYLALPLASPHVLQKHFSTAELQDYYASVIHR